MEEALEVVGSELDEGDLRTKLGGDTWDLTNGARACFAACRIRNFFRNWVSNRSPS